MTATATLQIDLHSETLEAALDAEDFTPLVRLVFDATPSSHSNANKQALLARAPQATPALDAIQEEEVLVETKNAAGRRASDRLKALRKEEAAPVISSLEKIVESRSAELSQICRLNAEEIVSSLQDLDAIQEGAEDLQERIKVGDAALRGSGGKFLNGLVQLQDIRSVQSCVAASCQAVGAARQLLSLCAQAGRALNSGNLYRAFRFLERVRSSVAELPTGGGQEDDVSKGGCGYHLSRDLRLHAFLVTRVEEMQIAIQQSAIADFNEWLVMARLEARGIGMLVLRKAAWERQREESLEQQRRKITAHLDDITQTDAAAAEIARPLPPGSAGTPALMLLAQASGTFQGRTEKFRAACRTDRRLSGFCAGSATLAATVHPSAAELLGGAPLDPHADVLAAVDMTRLHRCAQIHDSLNRVADFQEYYRVNRRTQLNNDLAAQGNFSSQHQKYLAQLIGFFVIEDRVGKTAECLSETQMDAGWETAVTYLKLTLETALQTLDSKTLMLSIKDDVLLLTSALGKLGYHVAPLQDVLMGVQEKFHGLLSAALQPQLQKAFREGSSVEMRVLSAEKAALLGRVFGLGLGPGSGPAGTPIPPFTAPFSEAVPKLLQLTTRFVEDSAAYLWGLASLGEVLTIVRAHRDEMLLGGPLAEFEAVLKDLQKQEGSQLKRALLAVTDTSAVLDALPAIDKFTTLTVRGIQAWGGVTGSQNGNAELKPGRAAAATKQGFTAAGSFNPGTISKLRGLQKIAEGCVTNIMRRQLKELLQSSPPLDWVPEQPVQTAGKHSPHLLRLLDYVQATLQEIRGVVSLKSYESLGMNLFSLVGELLMDALLKEDLHAFNLYSLFRLNDDARAIAEYASKTDFPKFEDGVQEVIQFCDLMVTGRLEDILDSRKKVKSYPAVNLQHLMVILRKYREIQAKSDHSLALGILSRSRQPESFLKKKTAEKVAKQLKIQLDKSPAQLVK